MRKVRPSSTFPWSWATARGLRRCRELDCPPFTLVAIGGLDWNRELSPWACDGTVRDAEPFGGQAAGFLDELLNQIIPQVESSLPQPPVWRGIAGYSLAGLFALWSLWQTGAFDRAASASGSLWFPDFVDRASTAPFAGSRKLSICRSAKGKPRRPNRMSGMYSTTHARRKRCSSSAAFQQRWSSTPAITLPKPTCAWPAASTGYWRIKNGAHAHIRMGTISCFS